MSALLVLSKLGSLLGLTTAVVMASGDSSLEAAVIAGVFMLVNSGLTIWLTRRLGRRDDPPPPEPPAPPDGQVQP